MHSLFSDALVLRLTAFREADVVAHLLTRESGALPVLARGARKSQKRFGGALDYFCLLRAEVRPARQGLGSLVSIDAVRAFERIRNDVERYFVGCHFLDVARRGAKEGDPLPELFSLLLSFLEALDGGAHPLSLRRVFQVKALGCFGYALDLDSCGRCGATLAPVLSVVDGKRLACRSCVPPQAASLSAGALQTLRAAARLPMDSLANLRFTTAAEAEVGSLLESALGDALGIDPGRLGGEVPGIRN